MAADPGTSYSSGGPYHLFLTRISPKLPKDEVEAALKVELASRKVDVRAISVVPQSAWKNKGFGFVILSGSPSASEVDAIAAELDNQLRVGGKEISVRVCQAPASTSKPTIAARPPSSWDQPLEKTTRLCAQLLHCYFASRRHQVSYKVEKLLVFLSKSVAPSCCQEQKAVSLWGRCNYGSFERMLLAIGESHFGGGWSLSGTIADRNAILSIGRARHMQGWDSLRDPLPIATLLRLAAFKQRHEGANIPKAVSGFSTPTIFSDCGSLMHSADQPSCSQSEASWSLSTAPATGGDQTSSESSPRLCTPSNDTEASATLSSANSTPPGSWGSCKSLGSCGGANAAASTVDAPRREGGQHPQLATAAGTAAAAVAAPTVLAAPASVAPAGFERPAGSSNQSCDVGNGASGARGRTPACRGGAAAGASSPGARTRQRTPRSCCGNGSSCCGSSYTGPPPPLLPPQQQPGSMGASQPPSSRDLIARCAHHLRSLFRRQPCQASFAVADVASFLSRAQEVVAWGRDAPYFSLEGYACAVYGSFERFLQEISRLHFNSSWCFAGGHRPGEPRVMFRTRRFIAAAGTTLAY